MNIKRYFNIYIEFIKMNISSSMIYRTSFWIGYTFELLSFLIFLIFIRVMYNHVHSIEGYMYYDMLLYYAVFQLWSSLYSVIFFRGLSNMVREIRRGEYDFVLTKPIDIQFLSSFRYIELRGVFNIFTAIVLFVYAILQIPTVDIQSICLFFLLLFIMGFYLYAIITLFMTVFFWLYGFNEIALMIRFLMQLVEYPPQIYRGFMHFFVFYIMPVGLIMNVPFSALTGEYTSPILFVLIAGIGLLAISVTRKIFLLGLKYYSSASS